MKLIFILIFSIATYHCIGQQPDSISLHVKAQIDGCLKRVNNPDSFRKIEQKLYDIQTIAGDTSKSTKTILANEKWTIAFFQNKGWDERLPNKKTSYNEIQVNNKCTKTWTTEEIYKAFNFRTKDKDKYLLNYFPLVFGRGGPFNGAWTAILPNAQYLVLRMVHSYPNGNQTSWYHERMYYFKKVTKTDRESNN